MQALLDNTSVKEDFRKLASICEISQINEIVGSDNIVQARVKGWNVVARKGIYNVGDKCIYVEIDSLLPQTNPTFSDFKGPIKTKKIRGAISQGVLLQISVLPEIVNGIPREMLPLDTCVTEILGITKSVDQDTTELTATSSNRFPSELPKTNEERIQNIFKNMYEIYKDATFTETEKLDGTSFTAFLNKSDKMQVCSRNCIINDNGSKEIFLIETAQAFGVEELLLKIKNTYGFTPMLQGECAGPKIQGNPYKLKDKQIFFFRLYSITDDKFIDYDVFLNIAKELSIQTVPIINKEYKLPEKLEDLMEHVSGSSTLCSDAMREGSVFILNNETVEQKNLVNVFDWDNKNRISFKAISNDYLLKRKTK